MQQEETFSAIDFCFHHNIEMSFIYSLQASGLIEVIVTGQAINIPERQLTNLEKLTRWHHEMDINIEGIETIAYLLERVKEMQRHILFLNNKLRMYED